MSPPQDTPGLFRHAAAADAVSSDPKRQGGGDGRDDAPAPVLPANPSPAVSAARRNTEEEEEIELALRLSLGAEPEPPKNKRPTSSSSSICYESLLPPKKRKVTTMDHHPVDSGGSNGGDVAPHVDTAVLCRQLTKGLIKLGKQKVLEESPKKNRNEPPSKPKEKLMSSAIRAAAGAATLKSSPPMTIIMKPPPDTKNKTITMTSTENLGSSSSNSHADRFRNLQNCSARLRRRLLELDATEPKQVCEKTLQLSDVHLNQNRLLISCKRDQLASSPITRLFTGTETAIVQEQDDVEDYKKNKKGKPKRGLRVTMLDDGGGEYAMLCRYLNSNGGYRFIEEWGRFLRSNGISVRNGDRWNRNVVVRLLAFRSRRLPLAELSGHRDGALGFVVLHQEFDGRGGGGNGGDDDDDEYMVNARAKPKKKKNDSKKEPSTSRSAAKVSSSSSSAAADVDLPATRAARRSLVEEDMLIFGAVQGIGELSQYPQSSSSSSSQECDGSNKKSSSDKQEKDDD